MTDHKELFLKLTEQMDIDKTDRESISRVYQDLDSGDMVDMLSYPHNLHLANGSGLVSWEDCQDFFLNNTDRMMGLLFDCAAKEEKEPNVLLWDFMNGHTDIDDIDAYIKFNTEPSGGDTGKDDEGIDGLALDKALCNLAMRKFSVYVREELGSLVKFYHFIGVDYSLHTDFITKQIGLELDAMHDLANNFQEQIVAIRSNIDDLTNQI